MEDGLQKEIRMYDSKVFGHKVSTYGLECGYLDYRTLSKMVGDCVLNNNIVPYMGYDNWDLVCGDEGDDDCCITEVFQYYIITESGYQLLDYYGDELVYYNEELDMFVWGITHFGTSWDYVLTNLKLVEGCQQ